ncbi:ulp1 protease family, C-terminal catalytic domain-containing protein [Artemisia annua]|uniref:Ulp1 protease family, C-terminal catalytic domain-containing protein n=1 Tax=Artemisia annua TaxID=35608 RepID=A0A2U1KQZ6_ARTAN|nr:ulp1 protease family, C-terminal catalytic domain-containing protein [Artemisia annua]
MASGSDSECEEDAVPGLGCDSDREEDAVFGSGSDSDREEDAVSASGSGSKSQRGPTIKSKANKKRVVTYNKRGVPTGPGAKKLSTFDGLVARSMVPITYDSWLNVDNETKEACWQYVKTHFALDQKSRKQVLQSTGIKWKNFKHYLYKKFIKPLKDEKSKEAKKQLYTPPGKYPSVNKKDWKLFVSQRTKPSFEEILKKDKDYSDDPMGTIDLLTEALGTVEQRGRVRGMGRFVTPNQYFLIPRNVKQYLKQYDNMMNKRLKAVEDELARKRSRCASTNASEGGSNSPTLSDEDEPPNVPTERNDKSCYLAVDDPSNIVAKGTIVKHTGSDGNIEVTVDTSVQPEALIPNPIPEEFVETVKNAIGYMLSWPSHLVIPCSGLLGSVIHKKKGNKKRQRELDNEEEVMMPKTVEKGKSIETLASIAKLTEKGSPLKKMMTRGQRRVRKRIEERMGLKMTAMMVDGQVAKVDCIKVQCEDDLFGHHSYTYLNWNDFDSLFSMDELSGAVVASYIMYLYEQIKNGSQRDHGVCFMTPTATMHHERKARAKNIEEASRVIARRLSTRKQNDLILLPYNPGGHWVLGVLNMKTSTCYYLDSLSVSDVNHQFKQIVDAAIALYDVEAGTNKRTKLNWVTSKIGGDSNEFADADFDDIREEWAIYVSNFIFR